jgi:hypothetical protein
MTPALRREEKGERRKIRTIDPLEFLTRRIR